MIPANSLPVSPSDRIHLLTQIAIRETLVSFGLDRFPRLPQKVAERLLRPHIQQFIRICLEFDSLIGTTGIHHASASVLSYFINNLTVEGREYLPDNQSPMLVVSNHPGGVDSLAIAVALQHPHLNVVANDKLFLRMLYNTNQHMIYLTQRAEDRLQAIRTVLARLKDGLPVLLYPSGTLDPDPICVPGSQETLKTWSASIGLFLRKLPCLPVLPVLVSGVIAPDAYEVPLARLFKTTKKRQRMAMFLQTLVRFARPSLWPLQVKVRIFPPVPIPNRKDTPQDITNAVIGQVQQHMAQVESGT